MKHSLLLDGHLTCLVRRGKGPSGQATALRWSGRRVRRLPCGRWRLQAPRRAPGTEQSAGTVPCPGALRRSRGPVAELTPLTAFDFVQTAATSQMWMRAARAAASPGLAGRAGPWGPAVRKAQTGPRTVCVPAHLLSAPEARCSLPGRAFVVGCRLVFIDKSKPLAARQALSVRGDVWSGEEHSPEVGAQSALRHLIRRGCLNAANEVSAVSSATRPQDEHRSAVGAKRRPPQWEPLAESACRAEHRRS